MRTLTLVVLLAAGCSHNPFQHDEDIGDPGFELIGTVHAAEPLDYAPVIVQAFDPTLVAADGTVGAGVQARYAVTASGPLSATAAVDFSTGGIGCASESAVIAWVDLDGDAAELGGASEYLARPGPGDLVAAPLTYWQDTPPGTCAPGTSLPLTATISKTLAGEGRHKLHFELQVDAPMAAFNLPFSAEVYRDADFLKGRPCGGCTPLYTLATDDRVSSVTNGFHRYEVDGDAEPLRIWLHGSNASGEFGASTPVLFTGEQGTRGRAAIGVPATFERL